MVWLSSKGIELTVIAFIMVGLVAIILLLIFIFGPLKNLSRSTFCFFYANILQQKTDICKPQLTGPITEELFPQSQEDYARQIAARAVACWLEEKVKVGNFTTCRILTIKSFPGKVTEEDVTRILETDPGNACGIIQNSMVVAEDGTTISFSGNCGGDDDIEWQVSNFVLTDQVLVLIKYDTVLNKIVISA